MTAASSNITSHWTFRDGRDYLFSLTTTETPNTLSFWISDKITGEEWTGCYDENGIEILTKRTGCFKSFQTFLAMIKSAILKKSDSVVLDLLNIEDLAAISLHRQNSVTEGGGNIPLNLQLYSKTATGEISSSGSSLGAASTLLNRNGKAASATQKQSDIGSGISNMNNNNKSSMNKRKYLIVTYIAEFDKVHYPLPLNYSNPPDLSVMQNNIITLKAEVTSLKSAKVDLEIQLESLKSGRLPTSHENNNANRNLEIGNKTISDNDSNKYTKPCEHNLNENDRLDATCTKCLDLINALQSKVCELENVISTQKDEHQKTVVNLVNANHFLRHKVEAAEKYELELWTQIQELKEKVTRGSDLGKEKREGRKDIIPRNRFHQPRHDLFYYNSKTSSVASRSPQRRLSESPAAPLKKNNNSKNVQNAPKCSPFSKGNGGKNRSFSAQSNPLRRSRSNSTESYGSVEAVIKDSEYVQKRILQQFKDVKYNNNYRSRSSSYHTINFRKLNSSLQKSRYRNNHSLSPSPSKSRFDPTAYVVEKKRKLSKIADQRLQKIESRIGSGSRPSPSEKLDQFTLTPLLVSPKQERISSSNGRRLKNESNQKSACAEGFRDDDNNNEGMQSYNFNSLKDRLEKKKPKKVKESGDQSSRPTSALSSSRATRIITHSPFRNPPKTRRNSTNNTDRSPHSKIISNQHNSQKSNHFSTKFTSKPFPSSEMSQRLVKSHAESPFGNRTTSRKLPNDDQLIIIPDANNNASKKVQKSGRYSINDQKDSDIAVLQNKLTALQARKLIN